MPSPPKSDQSSPPGSDTLNLGSTSEAVPTATSENSSHSSNTISRTPKSWEEDDTLKVGERPTPIFDGTASTEGVNRIDTGEKRRTGLNIGELFQGKYEIVQMIGSGGMGQVYQARHIDLGTMVAIKILHAGLTSDDEAIIRFKREARASAKIVHPNVVRVFDYGVDGNTCFLVMECLEGESLRKRLNRNKRLSLAEIIGFAEQVCYVLELVHKKGIVHRDLKPDNVFYHIQEDEEIIKILDFGIAKVNTATQADNKLTRPGALIGTPHYMSPEQCQGSEEIDGRADLYSLGIIVYELFAGRVPFDSENSLSLLFKHVQDTPPPLHEAAPDVPLAISNVVMKMLAKDPSERHQTAKEFLRALCDAASMTTTKYLEMMEKGRSLEGHKIFINTDEIPVVSKKTPKDSDLTKQLTSEGPRKRSPFLYAFIALVFIGLAGTLGLPILKALGLIGGDITRPPIEKPIDAPPAKASPLDDFVLIQGGTAMIGRDCKSGDRAPEQCPQHKAALAPYYLSKFEVTNKEYKEFITLTYYPAPKQLWKGNDYTIGAGNLPVTYVTWKDAVKYCEWRSKRDGVNYRLPTEEEWEYAARKNDARIFPWGDNWDNAYANANKTESSAPLPIDIEPNNKGDVSPFGIFAMAGNVSEWTSSTFQPYSGSGYKPKDKDLECKAIRGGSFKTKVNVLRTTYRAWDLPDFADNDIGFRLAAAPPKDQPK